MDKTPIQQAVDFWKERYNEAREAGAFKTREAAGLFLDYLDALLPKEKEFVEKIWNAAISHHEQEERSPGLAGPRNPKPDKFKFLNQLYPEK